MEHRMVEELIDLLKRQKVDAQNWTSGGLFTYPAIGDMRLPQTEKFEDESATVSTKTLDTIAKVAQLADIRSQMLELQLVEVLLEQGLGTPRVLGNDLFSPVAPQDIDRSHEVMKCLGYLAAHESTRLNLAQSARVMDLLGWFINPKFRCPPLANSAMSTIQAMSKHEDTLVKLVANKHIIEGVARAMDSPSTQLAQDARFIYGRLINHAETKEQMRQYVTDMETVTSPVVPRSAPLARPISTVDESSGELINVPYDPATYVANLSMDSLEFASPASTFEGE
ncbi:hypothetical protein FRC12_021611 [Ceratobasidium sp. 428]|nr:hypothetical protein FRC12_021611 [Ceratobasidium sp. 428]